ncbi:MAG: LuxR C-terminal-related transcriptional regulator [Thermomicrobiales bacterium]
MSRPRDPQAHAGDRPPQTSASPEPRQLTTAEAATRLEVTERTVRRAIARGDLPAVKHGGAFRVLERDVEAYAARGQRGAPATGSAPPRYLPEQLLAERSAVNASFIARAGVQDDLTALLLNPDAHIVTLTGPGGVGKSRLAMMAADTVGHLFPHGVTYVPLAAITDPRLVLPAIAGALWVQEAAGHDLAQQVAAVLHTTRRLIVLDNFEQILPAAPVVAWLAAVAPESAILVTSRAPLRVRGERELPVPTMPIAAATASPAEVLASESGRLFVDRAREHQPGFTLDATTAPLVAVICGQLDGLPLAIELAAARVKVLDLARLQQQLTHRLPLLTAGPADAPHRHSTMRDAIAWSYELLSPAEQRVFRQLAICAGGCTLDASMALVDTAAQGSLDIAALDHMAALVDHSLLVVSPGLDGQLRYGMLETIREFGIGQLSEPEQTATNAAHARFFLDLAWRLRPLITTRATQAPMSLLAADLDNIRAALSWLEEAGPAPAFARLVAATYIFMFAGGHFEEGAAWLARALAQAEQADLPPLERAMLQVAAAELLMVRGDHEQAIAAFAQILPQTRADGSPFDLANALISYGVAEVYAGHHAAGATHLEEALALAPQIADATLQAAVAARAQANLSVAARADGALEASATWGEAALRRCRAAGLELAECRILIDLGDIARDQGYYTHAIARYQAALQRSDGQGELRLIADALSGIASALTARGADALALPLFAMAASMRERTGYHLLLPTDLDRHERDTATAIARLGPAAAADTLAAWREQPFDASLRLALSVSPEDDERPAQHDVDTPPIDLTPREEDVLQLLLDSRTDREIANLLYLSPRTVSWHVRHILDKLGAASRRDAIARARQAGLPAPAASRAGRTPRP